MCNAFNHPLNCECGWGGVWYGATADSATWLFNRPAHHPRKLGRQTGTFQSPSRGATQPNAACPVCGERVYFYASPYGGKVFFDDLGPPWPKHPCTDRSSASVRRHAQEKKADSTFAWLGEVQIAEAGPSTYELQGVSEGKKYLFHFQADELVMAEIVRFRPLQRGRLELHILDYNDEKRCWVSWHGYARVGKNDLAPEDRLKSSLVHQHDLRTLSTANSSVSPEVRPASAQSRSPKGATRQSAPSGPWQLRVTPQGMYQCPMCRAQLRQRKVVQHFVNAHRISPSDPALATSLPAAEMMVKIRCPDCSVRVTLMGMAKHRLAKHGMSEQD